MLNDKLKGSYIYYITECYTIYVYMCVHIIILINIKNIRIILYGKYTINFNLVQKIKG